MEHERVHDATEPCPACGALAWEELIDDRPETVVACRRCGHKEDGGVLYAFDDGGDALDEDAVRRSEQLASEWRAAAATVPFPVYGLADAAVPGLFCGSRWGRRRGVYSVRVRHGDVTIESELADGREDPEVADHTRRVLLTALPGDGEWPKLSRGALAVWLGARERQRETALASAAPIAVEVPVDGVPIPFEGLRFGTAWALVARVGDVRISIGARDAAPGDVRLLGSMPDRPDVSR